MLKSVVICACALYLVMLTLALPIDEKKTADNNNGTNTDMYCSDCSVDDFEKGILDIDFDTDAQCAKNEIRNVYGNCIKKSLIIVFQ